MRVEVGWVAATGVRADNQDCVLVAGMLSAGDASQEASFDVDAVHPLLGFVLDGSSCRVFHAGDSLAFRLADGALERLTDPHLEPDPWRSGSTLWWTCWCDGPHD